MAQHLKKLMHPQFATVITFLVGIALTAGMAFIVHQRNEDYIRQSIISSLQPEFSAVVASMNRYKYGLFEARTAVLSGEGENIKNDFFQSFSSILDLDNNFPGARGFGFIRRVPHHQLTDFLDNEREENGPDFSVRYISPWQGEHYIIEYLEPQNVSTNAKAIGLDIASELQRRSTADKAMLTGKAAITPPMALTYSNASQHNAFLIMLPIYLHAVTPETEDKRISQCFGWAFAPLSIDEIMQSQRFHDPNLILTLSDVTSDDNHQVFYRSSTDTGGYTRYQDAEILGRIWRISISATPAWLSNLNLLSVPMVGSMGVMFSAILALLVNIAVSRANDRQRLHIEQHKLAMIVESSADAIIGKDITGKVIAWNSGAERMFDYTRTEAVGQYVTDLIIPARLREEEASTLMRVGNKETIRHLETLRKRKDGHEFPVSGTVSPIFDTSGKVIGVSTTVRDISLQKENERRIHELNQNLEQQVRERTAELAGLNTLLSTVMSATYEFTIIATDVTGTIRLFNKGAERMLGYSEEEVVGKTTPSIIHDPDEVEQYGQQLSEEYREHVQGFEVFVFHARRGISEQREWTYIRKDGSRFPVRLVVTAMYDAHGELSGYLGISMDITQQRQAQQALEAAKDQADAANKSKSMFLANMSHEIRTPMNAVLGMLQLLLKADLRPRQQDFATKAHIAATSLLGVLNDILDFSKIDAGKLELENQPFNVNDVMEHVAIVLSGNLHNKSIELLFDLDTQLPPGLVGDEMRLQQVLINLVSNAIKFTEQGEIVVATRLVAFNGEMLTVQFSVSDTGIGISESQLARIFDVFTQAEASTSRRYGGTGLGLVISRRLVEQMGGELTVQSSLGKGSTFSFQVTFPRDENTLTWTPLALSTQNFNVLVVDDNVVARTLLEQQLAAMHVQVTVTGNAEEAIRLLGHAAQTDIPFNVVLLDWIMPGMDGLTLANHIRYQMNLSPSPTLILVSAANHIDLPDTQHYPALDTVLTKPLTPEQLYNALGSGVASASNAISTTQRRLVGVSVLVVEDNLFNQMVISEFLGSEGAQVAIAGGGEAGVQAVVAGKKRFDVVLMDVQMPGIDGLEATRRIRANPRFTHLPIIAMTANVSTSDKQDCLNAGMSDHISKPLDFNNVIATLTKVLGRTTVSATTPPLPHDMPDFLQRTGGNVNMYQILLNAFMPSFILLLGDLRKACQSHNWSAAMAVLHTLKGSTGSAGLDKTWVWLVEQETQLKTVGDSGKAALFPSLPDQLEKQVRKEYAELQQHIASLVASQSGNTNGTGSSPLPSAAAIIRSLNQHLDGGNMASLPLAKQLHEALAMQTGVQALLEQLVQATEMLDFEQAKQFLIRIQELVHVE